MASITYRQYTGEPDLPHIISLVEHELSEPYVIYTYRYFLNQWCASLFSVSRPGAYPASHRPHLSFLVSRVLDLVSFMYLTRMSFELSLRRLIRMTAPNPPSAALSANRVPTKNPETGAT